MSIKNNLRSAIEAALSETGQDPKKASEITKIVSERIAECIDHEYSFDLTGVGHIYFKYTRGERKKMHDFHDDYYQGKVYRALAFEYKEAIRKRFEHFVHDLGIANNLHDAELSKLKIRPDEIQLFRREKILEDQQSIGFDATLLYEEGQRPKENIKPPQFFGEKVSLGEIVERLSLKVSKFPE